LVCSIVGTKKALAACQAKALERREKFDTQVVTRFPETEEPYVVGNYSRTLRVSKRRFLIKRKSLDLDGILESPTTVARDYLRTEYGHPARIGRAKYNIDQAMRRHPAHPLYASPCTFEHGYYVDIHSTYLSILDVAGWNVAYNPGHYLAPGKPPENFPFREGSGSSKVARCCLVSVATPARMQMRCPPSPVLKPMAPFNDLLNEQMVSLVRDVLHAIASQAIALGAVYTNTDGYICRDEPTALAIQAMIEDWGLTSRVKANGAGWVRGNGDYKVARMGMGFGVTRAPHPIDLVFRLPYADWLQSHFAAIASRR
jgi:hypothetical protein